MELLLVVFQVLYDLGKWMAWSGDRMAWNGQDLDSPDPCGSLRERYLSHLKWTELVFFSFLLTEIIKKDRFHLPL